MIVIAKDQVREPLYAVVPVYNPWRSKARTKHTERAIKHFADAGAIVVLVEIGFNRRDLVFSDYGLNGALSKSPIAGEHRHKYIGLHTKDELWLKENAINVGVQSLPYDWQQVCWLDSDVEFARPNWVGETIHKLQHYKFLQMFSRAHDLNPSYEIMPVGVEGIGFVKAWQEGFLQTTLTPEILADLKIINQDISKLVKDFAKLEMDLTGGKHYGNKGIWPGLAWACTRQAWEDVGGLLDIAIWGGGDWHMSHALIESTDNMMRSDLNKNYKQICLEWYFRCKKYVRRNVGVMEGSIFHCWHGKKSDRRYTNKHELLAKYSFDPLRHLKKDHQGLYQFHDDGSTSYVKIRDAMRTIAKERNEDSIDV